MPPKPASTAKDLESTIHSISEQLGVLATQIENIQTLQNSRYESLTGSIATIMAQLSNPSNSTSSSPPISFIPPSSTDIPPPQIPSTMSGPNSQPFNQVINPHFLMQPQPFLRTPYSLNPPLNSPFSPPYPPPFTPPPPAPGSHSQSPHFCLPKL
ncbi:probable inactive serine/threonine-protein kinase slob2 [Cajanus cajan]|uniref:probable inactive serine/threonine-protein kinase slob2 n=1 Tax=Cajanus cajan TaxID=3821 RepID=UPI00098DB153|nr:probable inactive serine/threonine-protein kinase slob2 [Cajanus cajan]